MKYPTRRGPCVCCLLLLAAAGGCNPGHGKHTQAFKEEAQQRMDGMKAATEFDMAQQQFLAGDLEKAAKTIDQSIAFNDSVARAHVLRGRIMLEQSRLESALQSFEHAASLDEEFADAYFYQGVVYERFSDPVGALEAYARAAKADPDNPQYVVAQAEMLIETGDLDAAEALLQPEQERFRHNAGVRQTLGHIAMMRNDHAGAAALFEEACLLAPDEPSLVEDLARAQIAAGDVGDAVRNLDRMLRQIDPSERPDLRHLQVQCLLQLDRPVEARSITQEMLAAPGGDTDIQAWLNLANAALILGDWHMVRQAAQRVLSLAPRSAEGYTFLALQQLETGRKEDAIASLTRAIEHSDQPAGPAVLRAAILEEMGKPGDALRSVEFALEHDPSNADAAHLRAKLMSKASLAEVN